MKYCYPNMPNFIDSSTVDNYKKDYIAERKKNGWRCLAVRDEALALWTRKKTVIPDTLALTRWELMKLPEGTIIDGELLDKRTKDIKDHYYAFDIQFYKGESVMHLPWKERRDILETAIITNNVMIELAEPIMLGFSTLYKLAVETGDEGIVIKNVNSKYIINLNDCPHNPMWFKAKRPEQHFVNKEGVK